MTESQEAFLRAVAARVPLELVAEVHLFPSLRQGAVETGLAVIATSPAPPAVDDASGTIANELPGGDHEDEPLGEPVATPGAAGGRHTVFSARYRLTLRGPERGTLEVDVTAEADAPLVTVDQVVRGIHRRSADAGDSERLSGDELRQLAAIAIV